MKVLRGRKPRRAIIIEDGDVRLELSEDEWYVVPRETLDLYVDVAVRDAAYGALKPLDKPGIDSFSIRPGRTTKDQVSEVVNKSDLESFAVPDQKDQSIVSQQYKAAFSIASLSFNEDNKWRLFDGQNAIWARIEDQDFLSRVNTNQISFAKGDILVCEVTTEQWQTTSGLRTETRITHVDEHRSAAKQLGLDLEQPLPPRITPLS